ncbi:MAG: SDR family oxidoreductase [Dehalococcoidia bacterium]
MVPKGFDLKGQTAIIVGRGDTRTRALAGALAEAHADLALIAPDTADAEGVVDAPRQLGGDVTTLRWDPADVAGIERSVEQAVSQLGKVDILVNDLSVEFAKPFAEMTVQEWHRALDLNLNGAFFACRGVARHMLERRGGRIINVASGLGARAVVNCSAFCAAMGGLLQLTRALALEWARHNVRVNAIAPGWIVESPEGLPDSIRRYIPMQRWGRGEDLGGLLVYLASESSHFMTGETVFVDGGIMIRT